MGEDRNKPEVSANYFLGRRLEDNRIELCYWSQLVLQKEFLLMFFLFIPVTIVCASFAIEKFSAYNVFILFVALFFLLITGSIGFIKLILNKFYHITPEEDRLVKLLARFIVTNKLYFSSRTTGKVETVTIRFSITSLYIQIEIDSWGSSLTGLTSSLNEELQSLLKLPLTDKKTRDFTTIYTFSMIVSGERYSCPVHNKPLGTQRDDELAITPTFTWHPDRDPHALVAGNTGGGKTRFLYHIVDYMSRGGAKIYVGDPKRSDLYESSRYFDVECEYSFNGIAKLIREVNEIMHVRYMKMAEEGPGSDYKSYFDESVFLIIDEIGAYLAGCDKKLKTEVLSGLRQIIFQGRQAGVYVVLATQKPDAETIPTDIRDQLGLRVSLGNLSQEGYRMVFGKKEDMLYLDCKPGTGYIYFQSGEYSLPQFFRAPLLEDFSVFD